MPGKTYIKISSGGSSPWDRIKKIYYKTGPSTWTLVRRAYIKTSSTLWKKVYDTNSNAPYLQNNDKPVIRLNSYRSSGYINAAPVQQMGPPTTNPTNGWPTGTVGDELWGANATDLANWVNPVSGTTITYAYQWLWSADGPTAQTYPVNSTLLSNTSNNGNRNTSSNKPSDATDYDKFKNTEDYLGYDGGDYFDKNWITFKVYAINGTNRWSVWESNPVYIVRQKPTGTIDMINTSVDVPETLAASFSYSNEWYRKTDIFNSKIEWFAIDSIGETLTASNRVFMQTLNEITVTGSTTKSGTAYHNADQPNKIYAVRLTLNNSNTTAAPYGSSSNWSGFTPNLPFTTEDYSTPGSALEVTTLNILDYYNEQGTDNRGYIPNGGLFKIQSNVTGVDGSTTYRIRYRMYNWQNGRYYGMDGTDYGQNGGSSAWTTRTGSNSSFGFGGTLINNVTVSGTTATLTHNETISSSSFGSTTYDGGQDRWQIEIEVSALKNSVRKYYLDVTGGVPYYVSRAALSTLTASPSNAQVNQNVTLSGSFSGLGGGNTYPRQYKIFYGDGSDSGWLPIGQYSYDTANPSFSIIKQYSSTGDYYPSVRTMPYYSTGSTSLTVSPALNPPTSVSINSVSRSSDSTVLVSLNHSGGSGPYYQMYWVNSSSSPTTASYDAAGTGSTISDDFSVSNNYTAYFYVRSSTQNLGNTYTGGSATAGTYSNYSSLSPNPSYTFTSPSGGTASISGSTTVGSLLTLSLGNPSASPFADGLTITWRIANGGTGGNSFTGGTILQNGGTTLTIPSTAAGISTVGYAVRAEVVWNNGVGSQSVNTNSLVVTAPAVKLSTPTNVSASDNLSTGINVSWTNVANAATYGIWWGNQPTYDSNPDFGGPNNNGGVSITSTPFNDTGAPIGTRTYYVQAFPSTSSTQYLKSDWSAGDSGTRIETPVKLNTPSGLSATTTREDGIQISWSPVSGANFYGVWYRGGAPSYDSVPDFGGPNNPSLITGTSYLDTSVGSGVSRTYDVQAYKTGNPAGTKSEYGGPVTGTRAAPVVQYTVTWNANGGSGGGTTGPFNAGSSHTAPSVSRSGYTFNGWYTASSGGSFVTSAGGSYTPTSTITVYAQWTASFTPPSSGTPSWSSGSNFQRIAGSSILRWYTDYPGINGDGSFSGMQFEIRTTAGGGTLLASGTRSYPGAGSYPYSGGGTVWAFRCGTSDGDISYSSSARFARVRTVMLGTNGTTYFGSWTGWI